MFACTAQQSNGHTPSKPTVAAVFIAYALAPAVQNDTHRTYRKTAALLKTGKGRWTANRTKAVALYRQAPDEVLA